MADFLVLNKPHVKIEDTVLSAYRYAGRDVARDTPQSKNLVLREYPIFKVKSGFCGVSQFAGEPQRNL
jgi:hypothetical protein